MPDVDSARADLAAKVEDTKQAITDGVDALGAAAQDLGNQAASLGREAMRIGKGAAKRSREAARKGQLLAATSGETLRRLQSDAASTVDDLRSVRIVRERRQGPDWKPGAALISGAGAGIAAMWFLDPDRGQRRRALFMDQVHKYARLTNAWLDSTARDVRNRSQGWAAEARKTAEARRAAATDYEPDDVAATPDVSDQLSATDWTEPQAPPPSAPETYRS